MAEKIEQLQTEFHTGIEAIGIEMQNMFKQMIFQMKTNNKVASVEDCGGYRGVSSSEAKMKSIMATGNKVFTTSSIGHIDLIELGRSQTKLSKLKCLVLMVQISRAGF